MNHTDCAFQARRTALAVVVAAAGVFTVVGQAVAADTYLLLRCQREIERAVRSIATSIPAIKLHRCVEYADRCELAFEIDATDPTECRARATESCDKVAFYLDDAIKGVRPKTKARIADRCGLVPLDDVKAFVGGLGFFNFANGCGAATIADLADCVVDTAQCEFEREIHRGNPRADDVLAQANAATDFPCVAP